MRVFNKALVTRYWKNYTSLSQVFHSIRVKIKCSLPRALSSKGQNEPFY